MDKYLAHAQAKIGDALASLANLFNNTDIITKTQHDEFDNLGDDLSEATGDLDKLVKKDKVNKCK